MGKQSPEPCPTRGFKGTSAAPRLRRRAAVSAKHSPTRARAPAKQAPTHTITAEYGPATPARGHDGTVTSITSAENTRAHYDTRIYQGYPDNTPPSYKSYNRT
jgi:hypothetical protein